MSNLFKNIKESVTSYWKGQNTDEDSPHINPLQLTLEKMKVDDIIDSDDISKVSASALPPTPSKVPSSGSSSIASESPPPPSSPSSSSPLRIPSFRKTEESPTPKPEEKTDEYPFINKDDVLILD